MWSELNALLASEEFVVKSIQKIKDRTGKGKSLTALTLSSTALAACGGATAPRPSTPTDVPSVVTPPTNVFTLANGNEFTGTSQADILSQSDTNVGLEVDGLGGNDTINTGSGADKILGGSGDDVINSNAGADTIDGGPGSDIINAGTGADIILGGTGNDTINAGAGNDMIRAGAGVDIINAGSGNDIIVVVGVTESNQYTNSSITNSGGTGTNLSKLISLTNLNGLNISEISSGEVIDGGTGTNTLHVYGTVDFTNVTLTNITHVVVNSDVKFSSDQLGAGGITIIQGDGGSIIRIESKGPAVTVDLSTIDMTGIDRLDVGANVTIIASSVETFFDAGIILVTGNGSIQIMETTGSVDLFGIVMGESMTVEDASGAEISVSTTGAIVVPEDYVNFIEEQSAIAPELTIGSTYTLSEGSQSIVNVDYTATSATPGEVGFYYLIGDDVHLFKFEADGTIVFINEPDFENPEDVGGDNIYNITLGVIDTNWLKDSQDIAITVTDINEAPVLTLGSTATVEENTKYALYINGSVSDEDDGDTGTYSLTGDDAGLFAFVSSGYIVFKNEPDFENPDDANGDNEYNITLVATDSEGLTDTQDITITVTDGNEHAPVLTLASTASVEENTTNVININGSVSDDDNGDTITYSLTGDDASLFTINNSGYIQFNNAPDFEVPTDANGDNDYNITLVATDTGGLTDTKDIAITVTDISGFDSLHGFVINGIDANDLSGYSVSLAGDINGDGIDDLIIGAYNADPNGNNNAGESYVVFGKSTGFSASFDLSSLASGDGSTGFVLNGNDDNDYSGFSVSQAGDINGDGIDDLIIGAFVADSNGNDNAGESYVVFGKNTSVDGDFNASFNLSSLDGSNGFVINGINDGDVSGISVSQAGDINGDGIDDLFIGASSADPNGNVWAGESYVVFGKNTSVDGDFSASFNLSSLDGTNGFVLKGIDANDQIGYSVSQAGDINGDGIDDLIFNAYIAGESFVVFGKNTSVDGDFSANINLSSLDGTNGFIINAAGGRSISQAGDINGDGIDDLIIGAPHADPNGNSDAGESYVVFGKNTSVDGDFSASLNLSSLDGTNGFVINGIDYNDHSGISVSQAGDINGDGIDDLIIGAYEADPNGNSTAGESYVVFGKNASVDGDFSASFNLSNLDGTNGFVIKGIDASDYSGVSVSAAGDINGDGIDDLIIGAYKADPNGNSDAGESYVVFGHIGSWEASYDLTNMVVETVLIGTSGNDTLSGTELHERIIGGDGDDTIITGSGNDVLMFDDGFGDDTVTDFEDGTDLLNFSGHSTVTQYSDLTITVVGSDTVIDDGNGNTITIEGITSGIEATDFIF